MAAMMTLPGVGGVCPAARGASTGVGGVCPAVSGTSPGVEGAPRAGQIFAARVAAGAVAATISLLAAPPAAQGLPPPLEWERISTGGPTARYGHAAAFDQSRGVITLYGGVAHSGAIGETWEWDSQDWTLRSEAGPSPRYEHAMAYARDRGVTVLFGGSDAEGANGETWEWNGSQWTPRPVAGPSARYGHAMVFDSARGFVAMFGGIAGAMDDEMWTWNGLGWSPVAAVGLSARNSCAASFDEIRGVTVLHGGVATSGAIGETWKFGSLCLADFNGSDGVTVQDIYDFLAAWNDGGAGCP